MNIVAETEETKKWYKYMNTVNIFNSFDSTTHAHNGEDFDSDANLTTTNPVILRNIKQLMPIICEQKPNKPVIPTEEDFIKANKLSFGDEIGSVTNRGTNLFDVLSKFSEDSAEFQELSYRLICIQHYQQNAIDKTKGIISRPMNKSWYSWKSVQIEEADSEGVKKEKLFNQKILADLKPYFFIYNYPDVMNTYKKYIADNETHCNYQFGVKLDDLLHKNQASLTDEEALFVDHYHKKMPISVASSTMNRICWQVEKAFINKTKTRVQPFDYQIMKSDTTYKKETFNNMKKLYDQHNEQMQLYMKLSKVDKLDKDEVKEQRELFSQWFKEKAEMLCSSSEELANIVVDICYSGNNKRSKQFAWDIAGDQIIRNLLKRNDGFVSYPERDENGDIAFNGNMYTMKKIKYEVND